MTYAWHEVYVCVSMTYLDHPTCEILWKVLCSTESLGMKGSFGNDYYQSEVVDNTSQWCHGQKTKKTKKKQTLNC
jgi:hypothetical protein